MNAFIEYVKSIPPSSYAWLLPVHVDLAIVDKLALDGSFPSIGGLWPAIVYAILFGVIRLILQSILFRVSSMKIYLVFEHSFTILHSFYRSRWQYCV